MKGVPAGGIISTGPFKVFRLRGVHLPPLMLSWFTRTQATLLCAMSFSQKELLPLPGTPLSSSNTGTGALAGPEPASSVAGTTPNEGTDCACGPSESAADDTFAIVAAATVGSGSEAAVSLSAGTGYRGAAPPFAVCAALLLGAVLPVASVASARASALLCTKAAESVERIL